MKKLITAVAIFVATQLCYAQSTDLIDYNYTNNSWTTNTLSVARQYLTATSLLNQIVFIPNSTNVGYGRACNFLIQSVLL